jgi:hypothetical protein
MSEANLQRLSARVENLVGREFGYLTVVRYAGCDKTKRSIWECRCKCGNTLDVHASNLKTGHTQSCGCFRVETAGDHCRKHGRAHAGDRAYQAWCSMRNRCNNPNGQDYPDYGGRGITICDRWQESFNNFLADMGQPPDGMSLDRFPDVNGNYEPANCRWATPSQQGRNKRNNRRITFNGKTQTLVEWGEETGHGMKRLAARLKLGWTVERALTLPANPKRVAAGRKSG